MTTPDTRARAVADHMLSQEGTGPAWGIEIQEVREGYSRIALTVRADMLNGHQIAHGAMVFAVADTAFAYACNSRNVATVAQQASIVFVSAAREGERLVAEAKETVVQGRTGVYEIIVRAEDRVVATFQGLSRTLGGAVIEESE
ncbi:MAG TPA: hydroxyphenylacetyl-CoA thioesterase PaaI [Caulobacteraceae bacterium]|jgi:acyl-CoA thioesterase|nr:hydroxyphenylacetyl-CoA thioesterase PaaI [Caulobacteraceae bacterium]